MKRVQIVVRGTILLLFVLLALLAFYYYQLINPPMQVGESSGAGVSHVMSIYGYGPTADEQLLNPDGLAFDDAGNFYIADSGHSRILVFDPNGGYLRTIGTKGTGENEITFPLGVAVQGDRLYVTSMVLSKMIIYDLQGEVIQEVVLDRPIRVKNYKDQLWMTTPGQIWLTDLEGNVLRTFFRRGQAEGQLNYPNGLAFDSEDNVFVSDTMNNRIQAISKDGNLVIEPLGEPTRSMNQEDRLFGLGMGAAIDDQDRLYIVDAFRSSIRVFNHDGDELAEIGIEGSNDGQLNHPSEIVYMGGNRFGIVDKNNDRVQVLALAVPSEPGGAIPTPTSQVPYIIGFFGLLIIGWIIWRLTRSRQVKQESKDF